MKPYLALLQDILDHGRVKQQRATLASTGVQPTTLAVFGRQVRYDLSEGFPLVTTKRVPFRMVVAELLWFLSGSTNNNILRDQKVGIWDAWADQETGDLGPIYGQQWRRWQCVGGGEWDQIARLVAGIREVIADPRASVGRRLILTAWNPPDMPQTKGPSACHTMTQFDVTDGKLSCQLYQRSADMFLGVPFNIASYALLTALLAKVTGLQAGEFIHTFGDAHIYDNHLEFVREQVKRSVRPLPRLVLHDSITSIDDIRPEQIALEGYAPHPAFPKAEVAV